MAAHASFFRKFGLSAWPLSRSASRRGPRRRPGASPRCELLEVKLLPTVFTWTGGAGDGLWSHGANWDQGSSQPGPGDDLIFPSGISTTKTLTNDFVGASFNSIEIQDAGYDLQGANLSLANYLTDSYSGSGSSTYEIATEFTGFGSINAFGGPLLVTAPLTLDNDQVVDVGGGVDLTLAGGLTGTGGIQLVDSGTLVLHDLLGYSGAATVFDGLFISISPYTTTYDGTSHTATGTATDSSGDESVLLDLSGTAHKNAGTYTDTWSYNSGSETGTVQDVIGKATLTAAIIGNPGKVYDGNATATLAPSNYSLSGLIPGESFTVTQGSGTYNSKSVGLATTITASLAPANFTAGPGTLAGNYILPTTASGAGHITPASLTVTGITASNRTYDGTTAATINTSGASLVGAVPGDAVSLDASGATGSFADKHAGSGKSVTISGLALGGADAGDYALPPTATATASIAARPITVTAASDTKVYDGTVSSAAVPSITSGSLAPGDAAGFAEAFATKVVGVGKTLMPSGSVADGNGGADYAVSLVADTTGAITPASLTVAGITAADRTYDGTTAATIDASAASLLGVVPGDAVTLDATGASGAFADKHIGSGKVVTISGLSLAGADAGNYIIAPAAATASISALPITVTAASDTKIYDGTTSSTAVPSITAGGLAPGDTANFTEAFDTKDAGTGKTLAPSGSVADGNGGADYAVSLVADTTGAITPASLTATGIVGIDKIYDGTTTAAIDVSAAALVGVEPGDAVSLDYSGASATFADKNIGSGKVVTVSGLALAGADAGNYTLAGFTTIAAITPASLTVTGITAADRTYDGTTAAAIDASAASLLGVAPGDAVSLDASGATGSFADKHVGSGKTVMITGLALMGADAGNYVIAPAAATASISALPITVTAASDTKIYDGTTSSTAAPSITAGALAPGDAAGFVEAFATKGVGVGKTLMPSGSVADGNGGADYAVSLVADTTGAITPASLAVAGITAADRAYDGTTTATINTSGASLVGVVPGDAVALDASGATGSFADKHAGVGKAVTVSGLALGGADAGDYTLSPTATATASIHPATLTVRADDVSRPFGQSNPSFTASYSGFVGGETLATSDVSGSPSLAASAAPFSPAGSYPIQAARGSLTSNDYTFALVPGTLTITPSTIPSSVATTTQGHSSVASAVCGQPVTFVAHVTSGVAGLDPTGTVVFLDGSTVIGTSPLVGSTATLTTASLGIGTHQIHMNYSGEGVFQPSQSAPISVTVAPAFTATTLIVQPAAGGRGYFLVARVIPVPPGGGTPTGSVVFSFNRKAFRTVKLTNGEAHVFVSARNAMRRWFTASYRNAPNIFNMSISNTVYVGRPKAQPMQRPLGTASANLVVRPDAVGGVSPSSASGEGSHGAAAQSNGPVVIPARPAFSGRSPRSGPAR